MGSISQPDGWSLEVGTRYVVLRQSGVGVGGVGGGGCGGGVDCWMES